MAINFEASNMAGYNNPKIEVFIITLDSNANIATAPSKSELINCTLRGSIPFLYMEDSDRSSSWLLPLTSALIQSSGNYELSFCSIDPDISGTYTAISICYPENDNTPPTLGFKELQ